MSSDKAPGGGTASGISKLRSDAELLRQEAHAMGVVAQTEEEQAQLRMMTTLRDHLARPATINSIEIHGAKNTRKDFLDPLLKPLVDPQENVGTTLGDVLGRIQSVTEKLNRFEIYQPEPSVFLSDARQVDAQAAGTDIDVSIKVVERPRFFFKAGTDVGNTEGSAYTHAHWRNILGGAESLSLSASLGTRTRSAYSATLSAPVNSNPNLRLNLEGLASSTHKPWASHEEVLRGGTLRLAWLTDSGSVHNFAYSGAWRQLTGLATDASPTVRTDAGDSLKSALSHTYTLDRRDNPLLPQSGYLFRTTSEVAGWGPLRGDVSFSKSEVELGGAIPIPFPGVKGPTGISVGGGLRFGMLYPLAMGYSFSGKASPSRINDRFVLGGPNDVRGFKLCGLGPHDGKDAVGGDVFAAGSVNMLLPIPKVGPTSPLRLQLFANGGRLVALKNRTRSREGGEGSKMMDPGTVAGSMVAAIKDLANGLPTMAAGVGLVYAHPVARFELNFSLPLVLRRGEEGRKGLQVGVGINFL